MKHLLLSHGHNAVWSIDQDGDVKLEIDLAIDTIYITEAEIKNMLRLLNYVNTLSDSERKEYFRHQMTT